MLSINSEKKHITSLISDIKSILSSYSSKTGKLQDHKENISKKFKVLENFKFSSKFQPLIGITQ